LLSGDKRGLGQGLDTQGFQLSKAIADYRLNAQDWQVLGLFVSGIVLMLYGVFVHKWYLNEVSAIFCMASTLHGFP